MDPSPRAQPRWIVTAALALVALGIPGGAHAQTVTAIARHAETGDPLAGVLVYLESETGKLVGRTLTDERGRALFFHFGPGEHRLRAEMIGMAEVVTDPFPVSPGRDVEHELTLRTRPIALRGLSVEAEERCRVDPAEGLAVARLWDEARKALVATEITRERSRYRFQTMVYEQDLDRSTRVVSRSRETRREAHVETPFRSLPAEELMAEGFVDRSGTDEVYTAPDARVLLSDPFLATHCFGVRSGEERRETDGLIGLFFEPLPERRNVVEVAGTLWIDADTGELRWLEYRYVNLDEDVRIDEVGGRVEFERMPDGGWIVPSWWIRMPRVALQRTLSGDRLRRYVGGLREAGGMVLEVQGVGRALGHSVTGALEGSVADSTGAPLRGVRVYLEGTPHQTLTDSLGSFSLPGLVQGVYDLRLTDPTLARLGYDDHSLTRAVVRGEVTLVDVAMPSPERLLAESCAEGAPLPQWEELAREGPSAGIVYGRVVGPGGQPLPDVTVQLVTPTVDFLPGPRAFTLYPADLVLGGVHLNETEVVVLQGFVGLQTTTDRNGFYRFCHLPERHRIRATVSADGFEEAVAEFRIEQDGGLFEHTVRLRPATEGGG